MNSDSIIPVAYYAPVFYNMLLVVVFLVFLKLQIKGYEIFNTRKEEYASVILLLVTIFYIGLRPISYYFADMGLYNREFEYFSKGGELHKSKDILWKMFMKFCSNFMTANFFFLLCTALYIVPIYIATKKWLGKNRYILFLMFIASFSFWGASTNGIRNGIATSIFILMLSINNKSIKYTLLTLSFLIHGSLIIPIAAFILTLFYKNSKYYLLGWLGAIILSLALGSFWENLFTLFDYGESRLEYLTMEGFEDQFSSSGFRWDFLLYSASAIYAGYYFIIKKNFKDKVYIQLFNIYVTANAFWILVIRTSFSNRFAYLSWFLMAVIVFYPFFKAEFFEKQQKVLAVTILVYFGFTYFMLIIL